jgi:hypothetical protein
MQKIFNLVVGVFLICTLLFAVSSAVGEFKNEAAGWFDSQTTQQNGDEFLQEQVLKQTADNLTQTLHNLLLQQGIEVTDIKLKLKNDAISGIKIEEVNIYIKKGLSELAPKIVQITKDNLAVTPQVVAE